jgi:cobalt-zinc-cadmium efflux system membrane fusion protein
LSKGSAPRLACTLAVLGIAAASCAAASAESAAPAPARVEARSADLLAVGLAHGDKMTIRLSRLIDNAPVRDAAVTVTLRGVAHPTTAEADGSFTLQTKDLAIPGTAAVDFQVAQAAGSETLKGTLQVAAGAGSSNDKNSARQLWWWVLNFAVCIGFLWLISRRRKSTQK